MRERADERAPEMRDVIAQYELAPADYLDPVMCRTRTTWIDHCYGRICNSQ
jgi:hypothetical protein